MPSISTNTYSYNPLGYEELLKMLSVYGEAYKQQEEKIAELEAQASSLNRLADSEIDKDYYEKYKQYDNLVRSLGTQLSSQGLSNGLNGRLMGVRGDFYKNIKPMQEAMALREKANQAEQEANMKANGHLRFAKKATERSIGEYLTGMPESTVLNLTDLTNRVMLGVKAANDRHHRVGKSPSIYSALIGIREMTGLSPKEALQVLLEDENAKKQFPDIFKAIEAAQAPFNLEDFYAKSGYNSDYMNDIEGAILEGVNLGLSYTEKNQYMKDPLLEKLTNSGANLSGLTDNTSSGNPNLKTVPLYSMNPKYSGGGYEQRPLELLKQQGLIQVTPNGNPMISAEGIRDYIDTLNKAMPKIQGVRNSNSSTSQNLRDRKVSLAQRFYNGEDLSVQEIKTLTGFEIGTKDNAIIKAFITSVKNNNYSVQEAIRIIKNGNNEDTSSAQQQAVQFMNSFRPNEGAFDTLYAEGINISTKDDEKELQTALLQSVHEGKYTPVQLNDKGEMVSKSKQSIDIDQNNLDGIAITPVLFVSQSGQVSIHFNVTDSDGKTHFVKANISDTNQKELNLLGKAYIESKEEGFKQRLQQGYTNNDIDLSEDQLDSLVNYAQKRQFYQIVEQATRSIHHTTDITTHKIDGGVQ